MGCYIDISNEDKGVSWSGLVSDIEYKEVVESSRTKMSAFTSLFVSARTDNLKDFSKDFFFPITTREFGRTKAIENVASRVFAFIGLAALDLITLAARIVTCIPRAFYNAYQPAHPVLEFLNKKGVAYDPQMEGVELLGIKFEGTQEGVNIQYRKEETKGWVNFNEEYFYNPSVAGSSARKEVLYQRLQIMGVKNPDDAAAMLQELS